MAEYHADDEMKQRRYELKVNKTDPEADLWYGFLSDFRDRWGIRYTRQKILGKYIVDFYCPKAKLIVELDGSHHYTPTQKKYDEERTAWLESQGYKVIRYSNLQLEENFEGVCMDIWRMTMERAKKYSPRRIRQTK
jgi:very-short-patch-repair endonuclease